MRAPRPASTGMGIRGEGLLVKDTILEVDNKGRDIKEVIAEWMNQNEGVWQDWINKATS